MKPDPRTPEQAKKTEDRLVKEIALILAAKEHELLSVREELAVARQQRDSALQRLGERAHRHEGG